MTATVIPWDSETALLITYRDVTDRESANKSLRETQAKYRRLLEDAPWGIACCDVHGRVTECNERFASLLGLKADTVCVGTELFALKPLKQGGLTKALRSCLQSAAETFEQIAVPNGPDDGPTSTIYFSAVRGKEGDVIGAHILVKGPAPD
jgi:PAS domain-containing protein